MDPVLRSVSRTQGNNAAVTSGQVTPDGFRLSFEEVPVLIDAFRAMVRHTAYDVCEMALTTYLCAKEHGKPFTALPVFLVRGFHHDAIIYHPASGLRSPAELAGRRVGVTRGYTVTTGVWARAVLADEYGVDPAAVTWVVSGDDHVAEYRPPPNVEPAPPGRSLAELLLAGELDAVVGQRSDHPGLASLIPDPEEAGLRALSTRGHYPINHLIVVRDELLEVHPTLAVALTRAFAQAKDSYVRRLAEAPAGTLTGADAMYRRVMAELGGDPLPYGVRANVTVIESLLDHALAQRILTRRPSMRDLFPVPTWEVTP